MRGALSCWISAFAAITGCGRLGFDGATGGDADIGDGDAANADADIIEPCVGDFVVDTGTDDIGMTCGGAGCSLRGALSVAPNNSTICLNGTSVLISSELVIDKPITIGGPGNVQRTGGGLHRLFRADANSELRLRDLTLANGALQDAGGAAILVNPMGYLTLDRVLVIENLVTAATIGMEGGAVRVENNGRIEVRRSQFSTNKVIGAAGLSRGGALSLNGTGVSALIEDTTFDSNQATDMGGALYVQTTGALFIAQRNTFVTNSATNGSAIDINCDAVGMFSFTNSTFIANTASDKGVVNVCGADTVRFDNCSFANNGTAIIRFEGADGNGLALYHANAIRNDGFELCDGLGMGTSFDDNMIDAVTGVCSFNQPNDVVADPELVDFGMNGGRTATFLLSPTSPARDSGGTSCPPTDQRGVARPQGAECDIGAVEMQ